MKAEGRGFISVSATFGPLGSIHLGNPGYAALYRWLALVRGGDLTRRLGLARLAPAQGGAQARLLRLAIGRPFVAEIERLEGADPDRASFLLFVARKG